jgi:hypothetical protein
MGSLHVVKGNLEHHMGARSCYFARGQDYETIFARENFENGEGVGEFNAEVKPQLKTLFST